MKVEYEQQADTTLLTRLIFENYIDLGIMQLKLERFESIQLLYSRL